MSGSAAVVGERFAFGLRLHRPVRHDDRRRDQLGGDDDALTAAQFRVAGREREAVIAEIVENPRGRGMHDDVTITDLVDGAGRVGVRLGWVEHAVHELALHARHDDLVSGHELVDAIERRAVGRAVTGDAGVARIPGEGGLGVVAGSAAQVGDGHAANHDLVDLE